MKLQQLIITLLLLVRAHEIATSQKLYTIIDEDTQDFPQKDRNSPDDGKSRLLLSSQEKHKQVLHFHVMGDVPYIGREWDNLPHQIANLNRMADFVLHVGDLKRRDYNCRSHDYANFRQIIKQSLLPVLIVPGDNDWFECHDKLEALGMWLSEFGSDAALIKRHWNVDFSSTLHGQDENWSFLHRNVFVIGLHVIRASASITREESDLLDQIAETSAKYFSSRQSAMKRASAVIIVAHSFPRHDKYSSLLSAMRKFITSEWETPFLFLQGEKHVFEVDHPWPRAQNFLRVVVDRGGWADPLEITVDPNKHTSDFVFQIKRHKLTTIEEEE